MTKYKKNEIINILYKVNDDAPQQFYTQVNRILEEKNKLFVVTANPEIIMLGCNNDSMYNILCKKATVIADGIGVVKALHLFGKKQVQRSTGIELVSHLLSQASDKHYKVFLYGSKENVLKDFKAVCNNKYPGLEFVGLYNGYTNSPEITADIAVKSNADIYLAALGTPKQELFINCIWEKIDHGVCVGIGGSIDVISGNTKRAPEFFINHNLEWLYRITTQPGRLGRFIKGNIGFMLIILINYVMPRSSTK